MKTFEMHLMPVYYDLIKSGEKTLEGRLLKDDKKQIKIGDKIVFYKNGNEEEHFSTIVTNIYKFLNFDAMANKLNKNALGFANSTKDEMIKTYRTIYPKEKELAFGVVVFEIQKEIDSL